VNMESHKLSHVCMYFVFCVCVCVCVCVSMCMYMIHIHILCVLYVVLCTCMRIQFAGEQRVSEQTKMFIDEDSVHSGLYAGILCVECACFILGYNCFGSPYTFAICTAVTYHRNLFFSLFFASFSLARKIFSTITVLSVGRQSLRLLSTSLVVIT